MPWNAEIIDTNIVELIYSGVVTPDDLTKSLLVSANLSKQHQTNLFIADCYNMAGGHSVTDLFFLISAFESAGISHDIKEALLLPKMESTSKEVRFYEMACQNRGYRVKIFYEKPAALDWLLSK